MKNILKRIDEGRCFMCNKDLGNINPESLKELRTVIYQNRKALVCRKHHYDEEV